MVMTITEMKPPVVELYSVYPLYLTSLAVGKRSSALKAFETVEKKVGIFYGFKIFKVTKVVQIMFNISDLLYFNGERTQLKIKETKNERSQPTSRHIQGSSFCRA